MTEGLLGSCVDMLGERFATGMNQSTLYDTNEPVIPKGKLITSAGEFFVTSGGDNLVYVEIP
jgi:hypothetical protein